MRALAALTVAVALTAATVVSALRPHTLTAAAGACDSAKELTVVVNYDYEAYAPMGTTVECVNLKSGTVRTAFNISSASSGNLVAVGSPFTPTYGSSIQYLNGQLMIPAAIQNVPGGFFEATPATWGPAATAFVSANQSYGYNLQPDEFLLYRTGSRGTNDDGSAADSFAVVGGVTFAPSESDPFAKHLFRYDSTDSTSAPEWFVNVSTPIGGFYVGVCATIDQAKGLYHFIATDTSSADIWTVDLNAKPYKATSKPSNDYGPEATSLTWNSGDGKLYAAAQTDAATVEIVTIDPTTGAPDVLGVLDLSANNGLTFQAPAAFNFDTKTVTLMVNYGGSSTSTSSSTDAGTGAGAGAACPTNAVYTWNYVSGALVASADVQVPAGVPACVWTPVTQDFNHKI